MTHPQPHPAANTTVVLASSLQDRSGELKPGMSFHVDDYWDRLGGGSWMDARGNPACLKYAMRSGFAGLPLDDEVIYGKVNGLGHLVHVSEIES